MSARSRLIIGFLLANVAIIAIAATLVLGRPPTPPLIQGVLLPEARFIESFSLLTQNNQEFTNRELLGRWHLVSYGFTTCPDICPTTLSQLATLSLKLDKHPGVDLDVLFYTVDHRRDTVAQMAAYVSFFDTRFIGLTHLDDPKNKHLPFEKSLGIMAILVPTTDPEGGISGNDYEVNHGVTLFLINPEGKLQAIFEPKQVAPDVYHFDPDTLLVDYLAIRQYLG
ncbi:MAG: protein SCO1/2 [Alcanivorax sp.]|jgi:protein SCO1/2